MLDNLTLESQAIGTITLTCSTSSLVNGNHAISVYVAPVKDETDTDDNLLSSFDITVAISGDANADGKANVLDVSTVAVSFKTSQTDQNWNPTVDLNEDGQIDILDISLMAKDHGKSV